MFPDKIIKPEFFSSSTQVVKIEPGTPFRVIKRKITQNHKICFTHSFAFAMSFYSWLKKQNNIKNAAKDYKSFRNNRDNLKRWCTNIFIPVKNHKVALEKAPAQPWLKEFYSDSDAFMMRLSDFLGLNGAYQWYKKGIQYPVINHPVHPFYGVYFPTRFEHLSLFDRWLVEQKHIENAIDIGTGCGVLALIMSKYNIRHIKATDINYNAVFSTSMEVSRRGLSRQIEVQVSHFTGNSQEQKYALIVFNPPWIPALTDSYIDKAVYYEPGFFENFFTHIYNKMHKDSLLVILFSDFAHVAGISDVNPIIQELENNNRFFLKEKRQASVKQKASRKKNWLAEIRYQEKLSLWVLKKK